VYRDVVGLVALDFILGLFLARVVCIPFVIDIFCVHLNDRAADVPGLRVPCHMITDAKFPRHAGLPPLRFFSARRAVLIPLVYDAAGKLTTGSLEPPGASVGNLFASHASIPPSRGRTLVIPFFRSSSATRALVASLGHEQ